MTAAFNLAQLANNLNTSGQLDATDGLSGLIANANLASSGTASSSTYLRGDRTWATVTQKILQVVQGSSDSVVLGSSNTWISNPATVSITPTASTSKILLLHHSSYWGGNGNDTGFRFLRNSTPVGVATSGSYNMQATTTDAMNSGYAWETHNIAMNYLDSPATTSSITYSVEGQITLGTSTSNYFQWNATTNTSGNDSAHGISTIIAIEVGA